MKKKIGKRLSGSGRAYQRLKKMGEKFANPAQQAAAMAAIKASGKYKEPKEGSMPDKADQMKHKMLTHSDKEKLLKIRQMLDKEKKK